MDPWGLPSQGSLVLYGYGPCLPGVGTVITSNHLDRSSSKKGRKLTNISLKSTQAKYISGWPTFTRKLNAQKSPFFLDCLTEFHSTLGTFVLLVTLTSKEKKSVNQLAAQCIIILFIKD